MIEKGSHADCRGQQLVRVVSHFGVKTFSGKKIINLSPKHKWQGIYFSRDKQSGFGFICCHKMMVVQELEFF